ncbi:MAG: FHA domain-containing protein [Bacteriovoracaceae bacterium]|nr:FHA domain-containing protein [Bacteriovoracaceae bacterium]
MKGLKEKSSQRTTQSKKEYPLNSIKVTLYDNGTEEIHNFNEGHICVGSRRDSDITMLHPSVESDHFTIAVKEGGLWVTDHNTKLGTFIDDVKLQSNLPVEFAFGSILRAGNSSTLLKIDHAEGVQPQPDIKKDLYSVATEKNIQKLHLEVEIEEIEEKKLQLLHDLEDVKVKQKESEIKIRHLESESIKRNALVESEEKKLAELKIETTQVEATIKRKRDLDIEIDNLNRQHTEVLSNINNAQRNVYDQNTEINQTINSKKLELNEIEGQKNLFDVKKGEILIEINELKAEKQKVFDEIESIKDRSISSIEELRDSKRMSNEAQKSRERTERELSNLNTTKHTVQDELDQKKYDLTNLDREVSEAKKDSTLLAKELFDRRQEVSQLEVQISEVEVDQSKVLRDLNKNRSQLEESEIEILRLSNYIQNLEDDSEAITIDRDNHKKELLKLNTEKAQVTLKLDSIQADIHKYQSSAINSEREYRESLEKCNRLGSDLVELQTEIKKLVGEKVNLKKAINNFDIERGKQLDELNKLNHEEEQLSTSIKSQNEIRDDLESSNKVLIKNIDTNKEELELVKRDLQNSLTRNEKIKEDNRNIKGNVTQSQDQLLSLEEAIKKNHKISEDSTKEKQQMLAEKNTVEFDLQSVISKHAHLEQSMQEMGKEKERKFEEMTQFKLRAEKDLEIMQTQTAEKKREFRAFTNDIEILKKKQLTLKCTVEDLAREKQISTEENKRNKLSHSAELQETRSKINAEKNQLKDHEFQTQKTKETRTKVELQFSDVQTEMKHLQHRIDKFSDERDEQLKKLGEVKAKSEQEVDARRKMLLDKLSRDMNARKVQLETEHSERLEELETQLNDLETDKLLTLEAELETRSQNFEHQKVLNIEELAKRVGDLLNFELERANSASRKVVPIDVKTVMRDIFSHKSSHQVTKKALLIYKLKSNQKVTIALVTLIIMAVVTLAFTLAGQISL